MSDDDGPCYRCGCAHNNFRGRWTVGWRPVCRGCVEFVNQLWLDLSNGQLVAEVAPEVTV